MFLLSKASSDIDLSVEKVAKHPERSPTELEIKRNFHGDRHASTADGV